MERRRWQGNYEPHAEAEPGDPRGRPQAGSDSFGRLVWGAPGASNSVRKVVLRKAEGVQYEEPTEYRGKSYTPFDEDEVTVSVTATASDGRILFATGAEPRSFKVNRGGIVCSGLVKGVESMCEGEKAELRCYGQWANPVDGAYPDEHTEVRLCVELVKLCRVKIVREAVVRKTVQEGVGTTIIEDGVTATIRFAPAAIRKVVSAAARLCVAISPFCGVGLPSCQAHLCCLPVTVSKGARPRASCSTIAA